MLDAEEHPLQAEVDGEVPVLLRQVDDEGGAGRAGDVEGGIEAAEAVDREGDERRGVGLDGDVTDERPDRVTQFLLQRLQALGGDITGGDDATVGDDPLHDGPADARRGAVDQRDLPFEPWCHVRPLSSSRPQPILP